MQNLRQYLYPQIAFSCNGTVTKWIYGANYRSSNQYTATPQLQIWRRTSNGYTLIENSTVDATARNASNLYEFIPQTPLKFQEGDIFGVYIPRNSISKLRLFEQRLSGPNNFRQTNVNAPLSTLDLMLGLDSDNDFPLVTVEISKPCFSLLPLHSLLGTSVSSTSTISLAFSSDIELSTSYSLPTTTQSFVLSPLPTLPPASSTIIQFTTNPASLSPSSLISSQGSTITSSSSSNTISSDVITSSIDNEPMVTSSSYPTAVTMTPHLTSSTHFQTANTITSYSTTKQTSTASGATSLTLSTSFSSSIIVLNNTSDRSSMTIIIAVISSVFLLIVFVLVVTALIIITHRIKKRKARENYSVPQEGDDAFNNPTYGANNYTSVADYQQVTTENMSNLVYECK